MEIIGCILFSGCTKDYLIEEGKTVKILPVTLGKKQSSKAGVEISLNFLNCDYRNKK